MRFAYAESFQKTVLNLNKREKDKLIKSFEKFEALWEAGVVPQGVGLKHLRESFFEFRVNIHARVLFQRQGDLIYYLLYGSHDDIRRFLKRL